LILIGIGGLSVVPFADGARESIFPRAIFICGGAYKNDRLPSTNSAEVRCSKGRDCLRPTQRMFEMKKLIAALVAATFAVGAAFAQAPATPATPAAPAAKVEKKAKKVKKAKKAKHAKAKKSAAVAAK
jgi:hypothetical protein